MKTFNKEVFFVVVFLHFYPMLSPSFHSVCLPFTNTNLSQFVLLLENLSCPSVSRYCWLFVCLCFCLSLVFYLFPFFCSSVCLSFFHLSIFLTVRLSFCLYLSVFFICLSFCSFFLFVSFSLFLCSSVFQSVYY